MRSQQIFGDCESDRDTEPLHKPLDTREPQQDGGWVDETHTKRTDCEQINLSKSTAANGCQTNGLDSSW